MNSLSAMAETSRLTGIGRLKVIREDIACCRMKLLQNPKPQNTNTLKKRTLHTLTHAHPKSNRQWRSQRGHLSGTSFAGKTQARLSIADKPVRSTLRAQNLSCPPSKPIEWHGFSIASRQLQILVSQLPVHTPPGAGVPEARRRCCQSRKYS